MKNNKLYALILATLIAATPVQSEAYFGSNFSAIGDWFKKPTTSKVLWTLGTACVAILATKYLQNSYKNRKQLKQRNTNEKLWEAAYNGSVEKVKTALKNGADLNIQDELGYTPLHWAAYNGHTNIYIALIQNGADLNIQDGYGYTPLHLAACAIYPRHTDICKTLIQNGANLDIQDNFGKTPLHYAAWKDQTEICLMLIQNGANINLKNHYGQTALDIAKGKNNTELIDLLAVAGGTVQWKELFQYDDIEYLKSILNVAYEFKQTKLLDDAYDYAKSTKQLDMLFKAVGLKIGLNKDLRKHFANKAIRSDNFKLAAHYINAGWSFDETKAASNLYYKAIKRSIKDAKLHIKNKNTYIQAYKKLQNDKKLLTPNKFTNLSLKWSK